MKKTLEFVWHDVREELPDVSGKYLVCIARKFKSGALVFKHVHFYELDYSAKHKLFNAYDEYRRKDAEKTSIDVDFWCEDNIYDKISEGFDLRIEGD